MATVSTVPDGPAAPAVEQIPLLSAEECAEIVASVRGRENGTDGVYVTDELRPKLEAVVGAVEAALARPRGKTLSLETAMVVHYEPDTPGHDAHTDDNGGVTINVALNDGYQGGDLQLGLPAGYPAPSAPQAPRHKPPSLPFAVPHRLGFGILHDSTRVHASGPCQGGARYNLVVWASVHPAGGCTQFPAFPRLQSHQQRRVLGFLGPHELGAAACASKAVAANPGLDDAWRHCLEFTFDEPAFRSKLEGRGRASRHWLCSADAKAKFVDLLAHARRALWRPAHGAPKKKRIRQAPDGREATSYVMMPRLRDARVSGLFDVRGTFGQAPFGYPGHASYSPSSAHLPRWHPERCDSVWPGCVIVVPPPVPAPAGEGSEELLQAAVARSRGTAWRLVARRPDEALVKYWVLRYGRWRGVYVDSVDWVHEQLASAPQVCGVGPGVEPPAWQEEGNPQWESGDVPVS